MTMLSDNITILALQTPTLQAFDQQYGVGQDRLAYEGVVRFILASSAYASESGPGTMTCWIQHSPDNADWDDVPIATFPVVSGTALVASLSIDVKRLQRWIRCATELTGDGSQTCVYTVIMLGQKKTI